MIQMINPYAPNKDVIQIFKKICQKTLFLPIPSTNYTFKFPFDPNLFEQRMENTAKAEEDNTMTLITRLKWEE